jgi:hypothetical protein
MMRIARYLPGLAIWLLLAAAFALWGGRSGLVEFIVISLGWFLLICGAFYVRAAILRGKIRERTVVLSTLSLTTPAALTLPVIAFVWGADAVLEIPRWSGYILLAPLGAAGFLGMLLLQRPLRTSPPPPPTQRAR